MDVYNPNKGVTAYHGDCSVGIICIHGYQLKKNCPAHKPETVVVNHYDSEEAGSK